MVQGWENSRFYNILVSPVEVPSKQIVYKKKKNQGALEYYLFHLPSGLNFIFSLAKGRIAIQQHLFWDWNKQFKVKCASFCFNLQMFLLQLHNISETCGAWAF